MDSLHLFIFLTLFIFEIITAAPENRREVIIEKTNFNSLAVIINENNLLIPAIAEKYEHKKKTITYYYDASKELFKTACPAKTRNEKKLQKKWSEREDILSQNASLLFAHLKDEIQINCKQRVVPSIKKTDIICNPKGDRFLEVGYPVTTSENENDIQFLSIYKICYSITEGPLYSIYDIKSPSLLLFETQAIYKIKLQDGLRSKLDGDLKDKIKTTIPKKYKFLDSAQFYNMPTALYKETTFFLINFIPILDNDDLIRGIIKYDNFVRLFSRMTNKRLTIYSGAYKYEKRVYKTTTTCMRSKTCIENVITRSLWRMVVDDEKNAVIIATQYEDCDAGKYICPLAFLRLGDYDNFGCTYMCTTVDKSMIEKLGLPSSSEVKGGLELKFPKTSQEDESGNSDDSSEKYVNITDFKGATRSFIYDLRKVDYSLAETIEEQNDLVEYVTIHTGTGGGGYSTGFSDPMVFI